MKKRFLSAAAAILICLLAGCGSSGAPSSQNISGQETQTADIGSSQASGIALADAGTEESLVSHLLVSREEENGKAYYKVAFTVGASGSREYRYEIQASDGTILTKEVTADSPSDSGSTPQPSPTSSPAEDPAATAAPTPTATPVPTSPPSQNPDGAAISFEEAKQMALERVPGATEANLEMELDRDDGFLLYEGEIHYNSREYEFEIDAATGNFVKWSEDYHD